jgi:hypothetical protein
VLSIVNYADQGNGEPIAGRHCRPPPPCNALTPHVANGAFFATAFVGLLIGSIFTIVYCVQYWTPKDETWTAVFLVVISIIATNEALLANAASYAQTSSVLALVGTILIVSFLVSPPTRPPGAKLR